MSEWIVIIIVIIIGGWIICYSSWKSILDCGLSACNRSDLGAPGVVARQSDVAARAQVLGTGDQLSATHSPSAFTLSINSLHNGVGVCVGIVIQLC